MRILSLIPAIILPAVLSACATLSEDQCRAGNWKGIGENDGISGRQASFISNHTEACAEFGIRPNATAWAVGRETGLKLYCTPTRAYSEGKRGQRLKQVCPIAQSASLERANTRGLRWYGIGREIDQIEREIARITHTLSLLPVDDPSRAALVTERAALRLEILTFRAERARYF